MSKATAEDDCKLLKVLKHLRGSPDIGLGLDGRERIALGCSLRHCMQCTMSLRATAEL